MNSYKGQSKESSNVFPETYEYVYIGQIYSHRINTFSPFKLEFNPLRSNSKNIIPINGKITDITNIVNITNISDIAHNFDISHPKLELKIFGVLINTPTLQELDFEILEAIPLREEELIHFPQKFYTQLHFNESIANDLRKQKTHSESPLILGRNNTFKGESINGGLSYQSVNRIINYSSNKNWTLNRVNNSY